MAVSRPLLSRAADSLFWMSRYLERAENVARMIAVNHHLLLDLPGNRHAQWMPLIQISGDELRFAELYGDDASELNVVRYLTFDDRNPNSILSCLRASRENAKAVRELISSEMWEHLNTFYWTVETAAKTCGGRVPWKFFQDVKNAVFMFDGIMLGMMPRGEGWYFCVLGRHLERADKTARIVDAKYFILLPSVDYVNTPLDELQWAAVLKSVSGFEMYRKRRGRIKPRNVVEFLLTERDFPRSVHHCVMRADDALHGVTGTPLGTFRTEPERELGRLRADFDYLDVDQVIAEGLHEFLDEVQARINDVGITVTERFFRQS